MFVLGISVRDASAIGLLKRELNKLKKATMRDVAVKFKREHIPPRFAAGNSRKWRHAKRNTKYIERKRRLVGHNVNLVLTGQSRRAAIHNSVPSGTAQGAKLALKGMPRHFFYRTPDRSKQGARGDTGLTGPDKVKEIKQVNCSEIVTLRKFARKRLLQRIKRVRHVRSKRLGVIATRSLHPRAARRRTHTEGQEAMPVPRIIKPDVIDIAGSIIFKQFETQGFDASITEEMLYPAGHPSPFAVSTRMVQPIIEFDTPEVDKVLANIPVTGYSTAVDSYLYFAASAAVGVTGKTARASAAHDRYVISQLVAHWTNIRFPHRGQAIAHVIISAVFDGVNNPVVAAGSVTLPGNLDVAKEFGCGPASVTVAGPSTVDLEQQDMVLNSGVELHKESAASDLYDTLVSIKMVDPSVEITSLSQLAVDAFGLAGSPLDGTTGLVAYGRLIGPRAADGASAHIRIDAANGVVLPGRANTADGRWTDQVRIRLTAADDSTQPITFTTGSMIT